MTLLGWDWGTVPAWVGSVLTGGSLILGFSIVKRDRRRESRRQASAVLLTVDAEFPGLFEVSRDRKIELTVHNASDAPITFVWIRYAPYPDLYPPITIDDDTLAYTNLDLQHDGIHHAGMKRIAVGALPIESRSVRRYTIEVTGQLIDEPIDTNAELHFWDVESTPWTRRIGGGLRYDRPPIVTRAWRRMTRADDKERAKRLADNRAERERREQIRSGTYDWSQDEDPPGLAPPAQANDD